MADPATAAKATGTETQPDAGTFAAAKAKAAKGVSVVNNGDGTYTISGTFEDGGTWSKTYVSVTGFHHVEGSPDPAYVKAVQNFLAKGLSGDVPGEDTNGDGMYRGKSLELGKGGRSALMKDRITMELVEKGYTHEDAERIARAQTYRHGVETYGQEQMQQWAKEAKARAV